MSEKTTRYAPGQVRDAILRVLNHTSEGLSAKQIARRVSRINGPTPESSVRSYLRLNTPGMFVRESRGIYHLRSNAIGDVQSDLANDGVWRPPFHYGDATLIHADCFDWLDAQDDCSIHAVVTDPPYGLREYSRAQQAKLRKGKGGVWRLPPSFDGHKRSPLPRFTTITNSQRAELREFFYVWGCLLLPKLAPGANVVRSVQSPAVSHPVGRIVGRWIGEAGRDHKACYDHARRRPPKRGA